MGDSQTTRLSDQLIASGLRRTPERLLVLEVLPTHPGHLAANTLLEIEIADHLLDPFRERVNREYAFQPCYDHFALVAVCPACRCAP